MHMRYRICIVVSYKSAELFCSSGSPKSIQTRDGKFIDKYSNWSSGLFRRRIQHLTASLLISRLDTQPENQGRSLIEE